MENLDIKEIMYLEKFGIINTISHYTKELYIKSYINILSTLSYPEHEQQLLRIVYRLVEWYDRVIDDIREDQFVTNKHEHEKSYAILKSLLHDLIS